MELKSVNWIQHHKLIAKIKNGFGIASVFLIVPTFMGDLQNIEVYKKSTGLNNPKYQHEIVTEHDIERKNLENFQQVSVVEVVELIQKLLSGFFGLGFICGFWFLDELLTKNEAAINYFELCESEKTKMDIDTEMAVNWKLKEERTGIRAFETLEKELSSNPKYRAIKLKEREYMEAVENENDETEQIESDEETDNSWNPFTTDTNQKDYLTDAQVKEVYQMWCGGLKLTEAFPKVIPQYNSTNANWNDIKKEFLLKVKESKKNENS